MEMDMDAYWAREIERDGYWRWRRERARRETPLERERREEREHDMAAWEGDAE